MDKAKAAKWFGTVELQDFTPSQGAFLDELLRMLDVYDPPLLDRTRSSISDQGPAWTKANTIEVRLVHRSEPGAAIEIGLSPDEAIVGWLTAHEHINEREAEGGDRTWTTAAVGAVAGILRGDYEVEDTYKGKRLIKTRVIDAGDPEGPRPITETGSLFGWVPSPGSKRVERRRVGFGASPDDAR
jgi:hypothetical protein